MRQGRTTIPWHHRLEGRVLVFIFLITSLCLIAFSLAAQYVVTNEALRQANADFLAARDIFYGLAKARAENAAAQWQLVAEHPAFRGAIVPDDRSMPGGVHGFYRNTVEQRADQYRGTLGADFVVVTSAAGHWLTSPGWPRGTAPPRPLVAALRDSRAGKAARGIVDIDGRLFLVVVEPVRISPEEVGATLAAGYVLDDNLAQDLAKKTRCEVSFVSAGRVSASSLSRDQRVALQMTVSFDPISLFDISGKPLELREFAGVRFVGGSYSVLPPGENLDSGRLVFLQRWAPTERFLGRIRIALIFAGGITCIFAVTAGLFVSRRITRAFRDVAEASEEVAAGNWEGRAPVRGTAEAAIMASAFNKMTDNFRHWHREALLKSDRLAETLEQLQESYSATLHALSRALDARDNETEGHSLRVTHYALCLADAMRLDPETRATLKLGALLHDIGKIGVPDAILRSPKKLTPEQMGVMERHCEFGLDIVRDVPHLHRAADVIRHHHERFDGRGYPDRLKGEEIPLVARIFAVADTLDAMTSDRPYRCACPFAEALVEIRNCARTQFDPIVVNALETIIDHLEEWRRSLEPRGLGDDPMLIGESPWAVGIEA